MKRNGLTGELIAEVFGTFILILLGDGVVANVGLAPRLAAPAYNWNTIADSTSPISTYSHFLTGKRSLMIASHHIKILFLSASRPLKCCK